MEKQIKKVPELLVFAEDSLLGISLEEARRPTEEEMKHFMPWCRDHYFIVSGKSIHLPHISWQDQPPRPCDGHLACGTTGWIISREEWDQYIRLNKSRAKKKKARERKENLAYLRKELALMEEQGELYTPEEARAKEKEYNDFYNEGGEGYVPHYYTIEEHDQVLAEIAELEARARN